MLIIGVLNEIQMCPLSNTNQNFYHLDFFGRKHSKSSADFSCSVGRRMAGAITALFSEWYSASDAGPMYQSLNKTVGKAVGVPVRWR